MKPFINKNIGILTISFALILFGFNAVQQYVTTYFSEEVNFGFTILIIVYSAMILGNFLSPSFVSKFGSKRTLMLAAVFYSLFILSLLTNLKFVVYICAALLGLAGALLWTAQNSYLVRASKKENYGKNAGLFNSIAVLGGALGVISIGFVILQFSFKLAFLIFAISPLISLITLSRLEDLRPKSKPGKLALLKRALISKTTLRLASISFVVWLVFGLVIGLIPLEIKRVIGIQYIGILSSLFFILPVVLSYIIGHLSDKHGREKVIVISYLLILFGLSLLYLSIGSVLLVLGLIILAIGYSSIRPMTYAIIGDISNEINLENITALFWMIASTGIVISLIISNFFGAKTLYLILIAIVIISFVIISPLLKVGLNEAKKKISEEI